MGFKKKNKKKKAGKVQSTRKSKLEKAKHTAGLLYYIIMIIFAVSLFITLSLVWIRLWPLIKIAEDITNSTTDIINFNFLNIISIVV